MKQLLRLATYVFMILLTAELSAAQKPEIVMQTGHTSSVESVAYSPDGRGLASASFDKTIKLWDAATGRQLRTLRGHTHAVKSIAFSPDGKFLASGSLDSTIKLWDVATGQELRNFPSKVTDQIMTDSAIPDQAEPNLSTAKLIRSKEVNAVTFSPDEKMLASGGWDKMVRLWDVVTGAELKLLGGHDSWVTSVAFSPDGRLLASGSESPESQVKVWGVATGEMLRTLAGHDFTIYSVAFSPNGSILASGGGHIIKLWDVATGRELRTLRGHASNTLGETDWLVTTPDGLFDGSPAAWSEIIWRFNNSTFNYAPVEAFFNEFYYPGLRRYSRKMP